MATEVKEKPQVLPPSSGIGDHAVLAHNNDTSKFGDVVGVFIISCGYAEDKSTALAKKIHSEGSALVYWGSRESCETIIDDLAKIGVNSELISMNNEESG